MSNSPAGLALLLAACLAAALGFGLLQLGMRKAAHRRERVARAQAAAASEQLVALRTIVDDLDEGIVVLDEERRAQFINRAFRRVWRVPDAVAESKPAFLRLMYHGRGTAAYAVSPGQLGDYVARQMTLIRTGEERPLDIRLANGEVLQFHCKALPGGGRLLTYGNVSELAHQAEAMERLASIDGMTGLYNRRHFRALAEMEWSRFQRYGRPLSLLMLDIDHFKSINDRHGHDVGDEVIKAVAAVLQTSKRASDIVGRVGGEEFALVLPEATLDNACVAAERLRRLIAALTIAAGNNAVPVTVSIGATEATTGLSGIEALIKQADLALYEAKRSGRNRVCRFGMTQSSGVAAVGG